MGRLKSIVTETDFQAFASATLGKVTDGTTIAANSWSWNATYKAAHVNDSSASPTKGCFTLPLGFLKMGDRVTFTCEFYNVSGVKGKIALDKSAGNAFIIQGVDSGRFENLGTTFIIEQDEDYTVVFGVFTADIGEYYVRNCTVNIESIYSPPVDNDLVPDTLEVIGNFSAFGFAMPNSVDPATDLAAIPNNKTYIGKVDAKTGYPLGSGSITGYKWTTSGYLYSWQIFYGFDGKIYYRKASSATVWGAFEELVTSTTIAFASGSPEGVLTGAVGKLYRRTNGAASTTLYVKESGTGNTGWKAVTTV